MYSGTYPETTTGTDREPTVYNLVSNNGKIKKERKKNKKERKKERKKGREKEM